MDNTVIINPGIREMVNGGGGEPSGRLMTYLWRGSLAILALLLLATAFFVARGELYTPGSDFGYNLGLWGGLLMLSLLVYPLRKRVKFFERLGAMNNWFRYHMFIGIAGPVLVIFHSTFSLKSMNATVAFAAMMLVLLSGFVGRFIYRHIHRGLYGRKLSLSTAQDDVQYCLARLATVYSLPEDVEAKLRSFKEEAFRPSNGFSQAAIAFLTLSLRARLLSREIRRMVRVAMVAHRKDSSLPRALVVEEYGLVKERLDAYLQAIVKAAQLTTWEKIFSLWHLVHLPFLYLLVISGIVHVIAVHMY